MTSRFLAPLCAVVLAVAARADAVKSPPTFNKDIAPLIYQNCMSCHRPGEVGPFPLTDYAEVKRKARNILKVVDRGVMPPWPARSHGEFSNERILTADQKQLLHEWIEAGEPEGNPADLPPPPHFTEGWQLGPPDMVLSPTSAYTLAADGDDVYRCFVLPTNEAADRWVSAIEVRPGNRRVVHHALLYIDTTGTGRQLAAKGTGESYASFGGIGFAPQGSLGGWAPGITPNPLPEGVGYLLPKGADVILQIHYHKDGKQETDQTRIGLYYSRVPVDKRFRSFPLADRAINIPAGQADYEVRKRFPRSPRDITLLTITPHMHWLGQQMMVSVEFPDGKQQTLIDVPKWDFNWQNIYRYRTSISIPAGSRFTLTAVYDNSSDNIQNPNTPPRNVKWGEQTSDEMCIVFLGYTLDEEHLAKSPAMSVGAATPSTAGHSHP
jgi:hypothetical protein